MGARPLPQLTFLRFSHTQRFGFGSNRLPDHLDELQFFVGAELFNLGFRNHLVKVSRFSRTTSNQNP